MLSAQHPCLTAKGFVSAGQPQLCLSGVCVSTSVPSYNPKTCSGWLMLSDVPKRNIILDILSCKRTYAFVFITLRKYESRVVNIISAALQGRCVKGL